MNELKAEKQGEIFVELDELGRLMEGAESAMDLLWKKMVPIISPFPSSFERVAEECSCQTPLGTILHTLSNRLDDHVNLINAIRSNMEI